MFYMCMLYLAIFGEDRLETLGFNKWWSYWSN